MYSSELNQIVQQQLASGRFNSPEDFLLAAAQQFVLRQTQAEIELKDELRVGFEQLDRGNSITMDTVSWRQYFADLARTLEGNAESREGR